MKEPLEEYKPAEKLDLKGIKKETLKVFQKVVCPACTAEVIADNLNLQQSVAKCGSCNVIFSIEKELESVKLKTEMKQEIFRPEGVDLFYYKDDMEITVQQHIHGLDALGIIFLPILATFTTFIFFLGKKSISPFVPIVFTTLALYYIYKAFNYSKNKNFINVNDKFLEIKSRPKNFKKDKKFEVYDIDQLYIKHATDAAGHFTIFMVVNGAQGQKHEKLVTVNSLSKAKYLEQEIERYLNIEDKAVPEATV
ncbi:MAG: hypothetical protein AB8G15_19215 [Saprospiraceae bacterium]